MHEQNNTEYNEPRDTEITALKEQINTLQQSLFSMQEILGKFRNVSSQTSGFTFCCTCIFKL